MQEVSGGTLWENWRVDGEKRSARVGKRNKAHISRQKKQAFHRAGTGPVAIKKSLEVRRGDRTVRSALKKILPDLAERGRESLPPRSRTKRRERRNTKKGSKGEPHRQRVLALKRRNQKKKKREEGPRSYQWHRSWKKRKTEMSSFTQKLCSRVVGRKGKGDGLLDRDSREKKGEAT